MTYQTTKHPTNEPTKQTTNQRTNEQPTSLPTYQHPNIQPFSKSVSHLNNQITKPTNQSNNQKIKNKQRSN